MIFVPYITLYISWDFTDCMGFSGGSVIQNSPANAGDTHLISGSGRYSGVGNDYPLQYSCLGNPRDGGAWQSNANEWACTDCAKVAHQLPLKQDRPGLLNMLTVIPWAFNSRKEKQKSQIFVEEDEVGEAKSKRTIQSPLLLITHDESRQWSSEWLLGNRKQGNRDFSSVTSKNWSPSTPECVWKLPPLGTSRKEPSPATTLVSALWNLKQRSQMNLRDFWPSELWNT